jgi:Flp pilus assembly protein TadB
MPIDPQARGARVQRFVAIFCVILFVVAAINAFAGSSRMVWAVVAVVAAVGAAVLARSFTAFRRKEY